MAVKAASNDICESFMAFNTNYHDTGLFGVYATCEPTAAQDMSWLIMNEVTRLCYEVRVATQALCRTEWIPLHFGLVFFLWARRSYLAVTTCSLDKKTSFKGERRRKVV